MSLNVHDPDEQDALAEAITLGLLPVRLCPDDGQPLTLFCNFVPRVGEHVELNAGQVYEVTRVVHRVARKQGSKMRVLIPDVQAVRITH